MSIKDKVTEQMKEDEEMKPEVFNNLILDEMDVGSITQEDKEFLELFTGIESLSMNQTGLQSLQNLPKCNNLSILELNDNKLTGKDLKIIYDVYPELKKLKIANNNIKTFEEVEPLKEMKELRYLDLGNNPIAQEEGYKHKMWEAFSHLEVLDGFDKDGNEVESEEEADDYGDEEEGEEEGDNDLFDPSKLTPEERENLIKQGLMD